MGNKVNNDQIKNQDDNQQTQQQIDLEHVNAQRLKYMQNLIEKNKIDFKEYKKKESSSMEIDSVVENNKIVSTITNNQSQKKEISTPSTIIKETKVQPQVEQPPKKDIDLEHVSIEKIFKITLDPLKSDKLTYVKNYFLQLEGIGSEQKFRVSDIDNLIINLIESEKSNIINFFFKSFHRSYEIVEVRFKDVLKEKFGDFNRILCSYLTMLILYPDNFGLDPNELKADTHIVNYIEETRESNESELLFFFSTMHKASKENQEDLNLLFNRILNYFNRQNAQYLTENKFNVSLLI